MKREPRLGVKLPVGRDELPVSDQGYKARFANVVGAHLYSFGGVERRPPDEPVHHIARPSGLVRALVYCSHARCRRSRHPQVVTAQLVNDGPAAHQLHVLV